MRIAIFNSIFLAALILLATTTPLVSEAFATCYANPIVGVSTTGTSPIPTGVYMWIGSGYGGHTGQQLVTAAHVVAIGSPKVYSNCDPAGRSESVLYHSTAQDWAILSTNGITFANYYLQGSASLNQGVTINTWSLGSFSGIVKYTSGYLQLSYDMAICTTGSPGSGTSGAPAQDATNKVLGITSSIITDANTVKNTCGSGYAEVVVDYNGT